MAVSPDRLFKAHPAGSRAASAPRPTRFVSVSTVLVALAFVVVVPLALAMGYMLLEQAERQQRQVREAMLAEAAAVGRSIDMQVATAIAAVDALSYSHDVDARDFAALHEAARRLVSRREGAFNLVLFDADGQQLLNTLRSYGEPLPNVFRDARPAATAAAGQAALPRTSASWARIAFSSGKPVLSDLFMGVAAERPLLSVLVPVRREDQVLFVWSYAFTPAKLQRLLAAHAIDPAWSAAVIDRNGVIVARHPGHDEFVGQRAGGGLLEARAATDASFEKGTTLDGVDVYRAHATTAQGWTAVVARPRASVDIGQREASRNWLLATGTFLTGAFVLVLWLGRELARPLARLAAAAGDLQTGRPPAVRTRLREVARLRDALVEAAASRQVPTRLALLEALVRHAPFGIALFDRNLRFVQVNDLVAAASGVPAADHVGRSARELVGSVGETVERHLAETRDGVRPVGIETLSGTTPASPDRERWWLAQYFPLRDGGGEVTHLGAVFLEITERKRVEDALRESEASLQLALDTGRMGSWDWDIRSGRVHWSEGHFGLLGLQPGQVEPSYAAWRDRVHPDDVERTEDALRRAMAERRDFVAEHRLVQPDGSVRWVEGRGRFAFAGDQATRMSGVMIDITERKLAEDALREADRRKDAYLATLAHELRNPLAPIRNALELLRRRGPPERELVWARNVIDRQVAQMARLLDDLLDVSRIAHGKLTLRVATFDLADALRDALETVKPALDAGGFRLDVAMPPGGAWVEGDRMRLAQVFANLLGNAGKYTPPGGHIAVRLAVGAGHAEIIVTDDGIGIDPRMLEAVFEPFWQAEEGTRRGRGGLGVGLALVKGIVGLHGGSVRASSEGPGKGAAFVVRLPLAAPHLGVAGGASAERAMPTLRRRILVADDNRDAADTLAALLRSTGATVSVAYDGATAVAAATADTPQVAILDLGMPGLDGLEVARRLAALPDRPFLIALTGWGQDADRSSAAAAGFDRHFTKPVDPMILAEVIARLP